MRPKKVMLVCVSGCPCVQWKKTMEKNIEVINILLKFILYLFSLDTWTIGHRDQQNFYLTHTCCPMLTSIIFSNVLSIIFHWTNGQQDTQTSLYLMDTYRLSYSNLNILLKCILYRLSLTHGQSDTRTNITFLDTH